MANRAWLIADDDLFQQHAREMTRFPVNGELHPLNSGRYFGIRLLQTSLDAVGAGTVLQEAREFLAAQEALNPSYRPAPHFELTFVTNLVLAGEWEEVLYYCDRAAAKLEPAASQLPERQVFHALYLFQVMALAGTGKKKEALRLHQKLDVHQFYFLAKKYLTILYLHLDEKLHVRKRNDAQTHHLVAETGFTRLLNLPF